MSAVATHHAAQTPADVAVIVPTILRPSLLKSVRSVYAQDFPGRIHLLIGIDAHLGDDAILETIRRECPAHISLTILDPGYSTSMRHGGLYPNFFSGSLRTVLSYLANSQWIAYLDDNDWFAAGHLSALKTAVAGRHWAWSGRWLVDPATLWPICRDEWDSVGPGRGLSAKEFGGYVQPSGLMLDKNACHFILPLWSLAYPAGNGEDRLVFEQLKTMPGAGTGKFTSFCTLSPDNVREAHHAREFLARGLRWLYDETAVPKIIALLTAAKEHHHHQNWPAVEAATTELLTIQPHHAEALHLLARSHHARGKGDEARRLMTQSIEIDDSHPDRRDFLAAMDS